MVTRLQGIACIAMGFAVYAAVFGMAATASAEEMIETDAAVLTRTHRTAISEAGIEVLRDIQEARAAISKNNMTVARRRTARAQSLVEQARWGSPTASAGDRVVAALRTLRETGKLDAKRDLQPIYKVLDVATFANEDEIRDYLDTAGKAAQQGNVEEIDEALVNVRSSIGYAEVDLPVNEVDRALTRAHFSLQRRDTMTADAELRIAADQVRIFVGHASIDLEAGGIAAVSAGPRR